MNFLRKFSELRSHNPAMSFSTNTSDNYYRILHPVCQTVADIIRQNLHNNRIKWTKCTPKGEAYSRLKLKFKEKNHTLRFLSPVYKV